MKPERRTLPSPVRSVLREPFDDAALARMAATRPRATTPRGPLVVGTAVVLAAAAIVMLMRTPQAPAALTAEDGATLDAALATGAADVALSDGTHIERRAGTELSALHNDALAVSFLLDAGTATFDVVPGGGRRWIIECGLATVEVVGTRFTIERSERQLSVSVERGRVLVRGEHVEDGVRALGAGERIVVVAPAPIVPEPAEVPAPPTEPAPSAPALAPPTERPAPPRWRALADERRWDEAYGALGAAGVAGASEGASVDELLALADLARLSGHAEEAVAPLSRVIDEHPRDSRAGLAAFSLGRVESQLAHPAAAAAAFARALSLGLPDALAETARAREAEALAAAGDDAGAASAARAYLRAHPSGMHAEAMRALVPDGSR